MTMNALAALAGAAAMGADVRMAAGALAGFAPVAGRGARREIAVPGRPMPNGTAPDALPPDATILRGSPADTIVPGPTPPGTTMPGAAMQCVAMSGTTMSDKAIPSSTMPSGTALLLDESYNGNGASMRAALAVLRLQPARRRIAVLGDMLELGDEGPAEHLALADAVSRTADLLFACGPLMRGLYEAVPERMRAGYATDSTSLALLVARGVRPGDAILVKGSLGTRMKRVVDALDALGSGG
jgi:UDP-N-acetylmuramyl pentapeptide synthase